MVKLHEHNAKTYTKMIEMFKNVDRVCCVQPTGTGKSFLILKLVEDNPERKFLIASPSVYIFEQLKTHAVENGVNIENVEFITFTKLSQMDVEDISKLSAEYIIFDEFHRLGAKEWGSGIQCLLDTHRGAKVLGTSATPIRYFDSMRDMAEELFDNNYAVNMGLAEAIRRKILPLPVYVTSLYQFTGEISKLERRASSTSNPRLKEQLYAKIQKAKAMITEINCGLDSIFQKHIKNPNGKYIVFCQNVTALKKAMKECDDWLDKVNTNLHKYSVHSKNPDSMKEFEAFKADMDSRAMKLLFCVDMLNEGIHVHGIDGVIMLRVTHSANVFYQQLGRTLSCSAENPVIFDIVNNYETGDTSKIYSQIMEIGRNAEYNTSESADIEFELYDYVQDVRQILDEIHNTFENSWDYSFELLREFKAEYNRFPMNTEVYGEMRLGLWCYHQKTNYRLGRLTKERIEKLESIDFPWTVHDKSWYDRYEDVKKYKEKNGGLPIRSKLTEESKSIYSWLCFQRKCHREGTLSDEKIQLLNDIGYSLESVPFDDAWLEKYKELADFLKNKGRYPSSKDHPEFKALSIWTSLQRKYYRDGKLSQFRIDKLNEINFAWDLYKAKWLDKFNSLKKYLIEFDMFPKKGSRYDGFPIGEWYLENIRLYENGGLEDYQKSAFDSIDRDVVLYQKNKTEKNWQERFELLAEFKKKYGRVPNSKECVKGVRIYGWLLSQKSYAKKGILSEDKIRKFTEIGIDIINFSLSGNDVKQPSERWLGTYNKFLEFLRDYHRMPKSSKNAREENLLYAWSNKQKRRYNTGNLSAKQVELLNEAGVLA